MSRRRIIQRDPRVSPFEQGVIIFACFTGALATGAFAIALFEYYVIPTLPF